MSEISLELAKLLMEQGAKQPGILECPGAEKFAFVPSGMKMESLERFFPPVRIKEVVEILEAGSFVEYVNRFKNDDTLIFCDVQESGVTFEAVIDYHHAPQYEKAEKAGDTTISITPGPEHCSHRVVFAAVETPDWKVWKAANRQQMTQLAFAEFLENNQQLFVTPKGADLLEIVRTLHGHTNARFNTLIRLDNGAHSVGYDEDVKIVGGGSNSKSGEIKLPPVIEAGFAIFQGVPAYKVKARLKARIEDRGLKLYFETIQLPNIIRESIMLLVEQVAKETKIVPLLGSI